MATELDRPLSEEENKTSLNFIHAIIEEDIRNGKNGARVHTRFPPEPNGYLHIGHAKSICLNFGIAAKYKGKCNLRFDDTNPVKEDVEYVDSIKEDIKWLGFTWDGEYYASDYFEQLYLWAEQMIEEGKAYVCDLSQEEMAAARGTVNRPGTESPFRNRSVAENLDLFRRMRAGEFAEGSRVLRAKIDMASPNMLMRDPILYRIIHASHHRTADKWCIYPMYDFAHGQSDSIEGITHSVCTLEFEVHRPLYEWFIQTLRIHAPQQIEFARLNIDYTMMSKRKLLELVKEGYVSGWDDPRMPTICGLRRRGYTPEAIRNFAERVGVAKRENVIEYSFLEYCIREDLNKRAPRAMAVLNPVKLVIDNFPDNLTEELEAVINPEDPESGTRTVLFSKELYIEREDFMENPPKKFFRLSPGGEVRLKYAYVVTCTSIEKDANGEITVIHCTYDPETRRGMANAAKKVKGTLHWVACNHNIAAEARLYDRLFLKEDPMDVEEGHDYRENLNPESLKVVRCFVEPSVEGALAGSFFQFERLGYYSVDKDSTPGNLIFNRTVTLKDSWTPLAR